MEKISYRKGNKWGRNLVQIYYPEKQLLGGYTADMMAIQDNALVTQNAVVCERAIIGGNAYLHGDACVCGDVRVGGNAMIGGTACLKGAFSVGGNAKIESENDYIVVGPIGSRNAYTTFHKMISPGMLGVTCGCFTGTIREFEERVHRTYRQGHVYREQYDAAIALARKVLKVPSL